MDVDAIPLFGLSCYFASVETETADYSPATEAENAAKTTAVCGLFCFFYSAAADVETTADVDSANPIHDNEKTAGNSRRFSYT